MWYHEITRGCENELLIKALKLFVEDKIDPEALKIMLRDVFEINVARINTKLFDEVGTSVNRVNLFGEK